MSGQGPLPLALAFVALALAASPPVQAQFPGVGGLLGKAKTAKDVGDSLRAIGEEEEIKLGGDLAGMLLGAAPLISDPDKQRYVNRLGRWLALHSERANLPWKFGIIESSDFNAFSTPGGYVLISRGLFDTMRNESELAGVLAHEIAHVVGKHHLKALQKSLGSGAFASIGKSYVGSRVGVASVVTDKLIESGKQMFIRGLDKEDEYEADRMGVVIATRSGFTPYGLVGVLQTLSAAPTDGGFALLFKTHPTPTDRITRLGNAMGTQLDSFPGLVDDLPSFVELRNPTPPPPPPAKAKAAPQRKAPAKKR